MELSWGVLKLFLSECVARGLKPLPISKDFSHSNNDWLDNFLQNFHKWWEIFKGFSASKTADFTFLFAIFKKWETHV